MKKLFSLLFAMLLACLLLSASALAADESAADLDRAAQSAMTALDEHMNALYDDYCVYYTADEYQTMLQDYYGTFGGVGISMIRDGDYITVYNVLDNGPAKDSPIRPGDRILAVDGESMVGLDTDQAVLYIRGDIGTQVTLTVLTEDERQFDVTLTRQEITTQSVEAERIEECENTAYFLVYNFTGQTVEEFTDAYNRLRQEGPIDWIIIDLRSNTGGNFYAAIGLADLFIQPRQVIISEKLSDRSISYTASSGMLQGTRLIVLENEWTASASEVLAGALRDEAGATLIGSTSFGKGITQVYQTLPSGGAWKYTHSRYYTPSGFDLHGVGLDPDIPVELPDDITNEEYFSTDPALDPHLEAAVAFIESEI